MRAVADPGKLAGALSIALFCYRLARALLGLTAALSWIDALIFTGGIGENNASCGHRYSRILRSRIP